MREPSIVDITSLTYRPFPVVYNGGQVRTYVTLAKQDKSNLPLVSLARGTTLVGRPRARHTHVISKHRSDPFSSFYPVRDFKKLSVRLLHTKREEGGNWLRAQINRQIFVNCASYFEKGFGERLCVFFDVDLSQAA